MSDDNDHTLHPVTDEQLERDREWRDRQDEKQQPCAAKSPQGLECRLPQGHEGQHFNRKFGLKWPDVYVAPAQPPAAPPRKTVNQMIAELPDGSTGGNMGRTFTAPFGELHEHLKDCCGGCPYCVELCQAVVDEVNHVLLPPPAAGAQGAREWTEQNADDHGADALVTNIAPHQAAWTREKHLAALATYAAHVAGPLVQLLKDACDRDWKDETPAQVVAIAANAIYWRGRSAKEAEARAEAATSECGKLRAVLRDEYGRSDL